VSERRKAEGVDFPPHGLTKGGIDQAVTLNGRLAFESVGNHRGLEMHAIIAAHSHFGSGHSGVDHLLYS
jgi:hypothetical protein